MEQNEKELQENRARQGSSYERQLRKLQGQSTARCARGEYHHNRDKERRQEYYEATAESHSAKTRLRYNVSVSRETLGGSRSLFPSEHVRDILRTMKKGPLLSLMKLT